MKSMTVACCLLCRTRPCKLRAGAHQTQCAGSCSQRAGAQCHHAGCPKGPPHEQHSPRQPGLVAGGAGQCHVPGQASSTTPGVCSPRWIVPIRRLCVWRSSTSVWRLRKRAQAHLPGGAPGANTSRWRRLALPPTSPTPTLRGAALNRLPMRHRGSAQMSRSIQYTSSPLLASRTPVWRSKLLVAAWRSHLADWLHVLPTSRWLPTISSSTRALCASVVRLSCRQPWTHPGPKWSHPGVQCSIAQHLGHSGRRGNRQETAAATGQAAGHVGS